MNSTREILRRGLLASVAFGVVLLPLRLISQSQTPQPPAAEEAIPAFHAEAPRGALPETLSPSLFANPVVQNAYALAAQVKKLLYQQPCYCHCDRSQGHKSLHSCFEGTHGAMCSVCMAEVFYSYQMSKQHKSAAEIRKGIIAGEYKKVDLQTATSIN